MPWLLVRTKFDSKGLYHARTLSRLVHDELASVHGPDWMWEAHGADEIRELRAGRARRLLPKLKADSLRHFPVWWGVRSNVDVDVARVTDLLRLRER